MVATSQDFTNLIALCSPRAVLSDCDGVYLLKISFPYFCHIFVLAEIHMPCSCLCSCHYKYQWPVLLKPTEQTHASEMCFFFLWS